MASTEQRPAPSRRSGSGPLDRLVEDAAQRITRFTPPEALSVAATDGVIIDIRSQDVRELHGVVPGSLHIPRTVLEWRAAVDSPWRNPYIGGLDQRLILICDHGPRRPALCPVQGLPPRPLTRETRLFGWTIA